MDTLYVTKTHRVLGFPNLDDNDIIIQKLRWGKFVYMTKFVADQLKNIEGFGDQQEGQGLGVVSISTTLSNKDIIGKLQEILKPKRAIEI